MALNEVVQDIADQCHHRYSEHNINLEQFSTMLIQECIEQAMKSWNTPDGYGTVKGQEVAAEFIRKHFGMS